MTSPATPVKGGDLAPHRLGASLARARGAARDLLSWLEARHRVLLAALVGLTLAGGLAYSILHDDTFRFVDERSYYELARSLAEEGRFLANGGRTAFWAPGWPMVLSLFMRLGLPPAAIHMVNFVLLAASLLLLWLLGRAWGGDGAGVLAAALALAYPLVFFTAGTFYPQTLCGFLLLLAAHLLSRRERTGVVRAALAGAVLGFLGLTAPMLTVALGVALVWMARPAWRRAAPAAVTLLLVATAVMGLWTARNYRVFGRFVPVSTNSGINLLIGNHDDARPTSGSNVDISADLQAASGLDEVDRDRFLRSRALRTMGQHPGHSVALYLGKLANWFVSRDEIATPTPIARLWQPVMLLAYAPLLALLAIRLALWRRLRPTGIETLLLSLYVAAGAAYALFFTRVRFRMPLDLLLCLLVALFVHRVVRPQAPAGLEPRPQAPAGLGDGEQDRAGAS